MAAIRVSVPGVGTRHIDLGPARGIHHDYERERHDALRYLDGHPLYRLARIEALEVRPR